MGMFDTAWIRCPKCHHENGLQSKTGECLLYNYPAYKVPFSVAAGLLNPYHYAKDAYGYIDCENCDAKLYLTAMPTLNSQYVVMELHERIYNMTPQREQYE